MGSFLRFNHVLRNTNKYEMLEEETGFDDLYTTHGLVGGQSVINHVINVNYVNKG